MNNEKRKALQMISDQLSEIQGKLNDLKDAIELHRDDEQEKFDNMPEGLQQADKGCAMQDAIGGLEEAASAAENACTEVGSTLDSINNVISA